MKFELFKNIIETYEKGSSMLSELHDLGFDFFEGKYQLSNIHYKQLENIILSLYGEKGLEWVEWFIFENDYGKNNLEAFDNNQRICDTIENLYLYLEKNN